MNATESSLRQAWRSAYGLLWLALVAGYLAASLIGYRQAALAAVGLMAGMLVAASGHRLAGLVVGLALAAACLRWSDALLPFVYAPPLAGFAFMAWFFGRTLAPGVEPLISRVARREHDPLPADIARFTRLLTQLWTACFLLLLLTGLSLLPLLSLERWSRCMQVLGVALPLLLFLGEYAYRQHRFRQYRHASLPRLVANIVVVMKEAAAAGPRAMLSQDGH